jgi:starch synthase
VSGNMKILILSSEMVPFAKTGGLADVVGALPKALRALGHDVRVAIPRYARIDASRFGMKPELAPFPVALDTATETVSVEKTTVGSGDLEVPVYFVANEKYFGREGVYGYPDDGERFVLFCRGAIEMLKRLDWQPDVVHCNDWHTGIVPNWLKTIYRDDPFFANMATVYTIHNLQYQGVFGRRILEVAGIESHGFLYHPQIGELANVVDFMARGIHFADIINTVSERYAQEILTPEYGEKLDPLLRDRKDRLYGILNGLDYEETNPATDTYIARQFDVTSLDARAENKAALQREAGLDVNPETPVIGLVSRMVDQKGFDLLAQIFDWLMKALRAQFVLLGTGDQHYHNLFTKYQKDYAGQAAIFLTFNASLAQKIYAGSDMFLMPSRFEPCGLGQLIALRYGCIPIVRKTGGLADTVSDFNPRTREGNGFVFERYNHVDLYTAIVRAVEEYRSPETWRMLQERGMTADYSWSVSARKYADLYAKAMEYRMAEHG